MRSLFSILILVFCLNQIYSKVPIIIDTDIGGDIDDSWALAVLCQSEETVDIKLALSATLDTTGKAKIIAQYLTEVGKDTIPVGIGVKQNNNHGALYGWSQDFNLTTYKGGVFQDGVGKMIEILENTNETITIIELAPETNLLSLIQRRPDLLPKVRIIAMGGSIDECYNHGKGDCPEYNIREDIPASQATFATKTWQSPIQLAPIDVCIDSVLDGALYQKLLSAKDNKIVSVLLECYNYWHQHGGGGDPASHSTILWDPTATFMLLEKSLYEFTEMHLIVNDDGDTVSSSNGTVVDVSLKWATNGLENWKESMVNVLLGMN